MKQSGCHRLGFAPQEAHLRKFQHKLRYQIAQIHFYFVVRNIGSIEQFIPLFSVLQADIHLVAKLYQNHTLLKPFYHLRQLSFKPSSSETLLKVTCQHRLSFYSYLVTQNVVSRVKLNWNYFKTRVKEHGR